MAVPNNMEALEWLRRRLDADGSDPLTTLTLSSPDLLIEIPHPEFLGGLKGPPPGGGPLLRLLVSKPRLEKGTESG